LLRNLPEGHEMGTRNFDSTKLERILHLYMAIKASPDKTPKEIRQEFDKKLKSYGKSQI